MAKLPEEVKLQIAWVTTRDAWQINELLKVIIRAEVEARELSKKIKIQESWQ